MNPYIAIVNTENNRVSKYQDFESQAEAQSHVDQYGGVVYHNVNGDRLKDIFMDGETVSISPVVDPAPEIIYSPSEFFDRFVQAERKAIRQAAKANDDLDEWMQRLMMAHEGVNTSSQAVIDGMAALVVAGLITQERSDEILSI